MDSTNYYYQQLTHAQILVEEPHIAKADKSRVHGAANAYVVYARIRGCPRPAALLVTQAFALPEIPRLKIETPKQNIQSEEEEREEELQAHSRRLREIKEQSRRDKNSVNKLKNILRYPKPSIALRIALENSPTGMVFINFADRARKLQTEFNIVLEQLARAQTDTQAALLRGADAIQAFKRLQADTNRTTELAYQYGLEDQCIVESIEAVWSKHWPDVRRIPEDGELIRYRGELPVEFCRSTLAPNTNQPPVSRTWRYPSPFPSHRLRTRSPYPIPSWENCRTSPNHERSIRGTQRDAPQPRTNSASHPSSRTLASGSEVDPIVISDDDEIVSDEETPSDMIRAEVEWHRRHRTDSARNLWSVKPSEDGWNDFDYGDMGSWDYNNEVETAW
jgi:hypothetical protein